MPVAATADRLDADLRHLPEKLRDAVSGTRSPPPPLRTASFQSSGSCTYRSVLCGSTAVARVPLSTSAARSKWHSRQATTETEGC
jgi:hypothetical protein